MEDWGELFLNPCVLISAKGDNIPSFSEMNPTESPPALPAGGRVGSWRGGEGLCMGTTRPQAPRQELIPGPDFLVGMEDWGELFLNPCVRISAKGDNIPPFPK